MTYDERYKTKKQVMDRVMELILELSEKQTLELLEYLDSKRKKRHRTAKRKECATTVYFATSDRIYKSDIRDISKTGVFINTTDTFCVGQELLMTFSFPGFGKSFNFNGTVVRGTRQGIGVQFTGLTQDQDKILEDILTCVCG